MPYLLDTNMLIALSKTRGGVAERLGSLPASAIVLSSVVVAEIEYGIAKSSHQARNRKVFDALLNGFQTAPFDHAAARHYGPLRATLEQHGRLIGPNDLMIAAHALSLDAVVVTDNVSEFTRVEGLKVENWLD